MNGGAGASAILGMKLFLPEANRAGGGRRRKSEKRFEALGPGELAGGYRPNPNSVMRSFGSERKMLRDFKRAARRVRSNFMGLVGRWLCGPVCLSSFIGLNFGRKSHDQVAGGTRALNS
jgi:hypothetical protein